MRRFGQLREDAQVAAETNIWCYKMHSGYSLCLFVTLLVVSMNSCNSSSGAAVAHVDHVVRDSTYARFSSLFTTPTALK